MEDYQLGQASALLGASAEKQAESAPALSYGLKGKLYLSKSGWLLLSVPNALARGAFDALHEQGVELPESKGGFNAHITVMRPDEIETIEGGAEAIKERGQEFPYTLGPVRTTNPAGWGEMSRVWFIEVLSPELKKLRKRYGLSPLPKEGKHPFHITVGVRRKGVFQKASSLIHAQKADPTDRFLGQAIGPVSSHTPVQGAEPYDIQSLAQARQASPEDLEGVKVQTPLEDLKKVKTYSDRGDYAAKHALLRKLIHQRPGEFFVDEEEGHVAGITHRPTGFRFHLPRKTLPSGLEKQAAPKWIKMIRGGRLSPSSITRIAKSMPKGKFRLLRDLAKKKGVPQRSQIVGNIGQAPGVQTVPTSIVKQAPKPRAAPAGRLKQYLRFWAGRKPDEKIGLKGFYNMAAKPSYGILDRPTGLSRNPFKRVTDRPLDRTRQALATGLRAGRTGLFLGGAGAGAYTAGVTVPETIADTVGSEAVQPVEGARPMGLMSPQEVAQFRKAVTGRNALRLYQQPIKGLWEGNQFSEAVTDAATHGLSRELSHALAPSESKPSPAEAAANAVRGTTPVGALTPLLKRLGAQKMTPEQQSQLSGERETKAVKALRTFLEDPAHAQESSYYRYLLGPRGVIPEETRRRFVGRMAGPTLDKVFGYPLLPGEEAGSRPWRKQNRPPQKPGWKLPGWAGGAAIPLGWSKPTRWIGEKLHGFDQTLHDNLQTIPALHLNKLPEHLAQLRHKYPRGYQRAVRLGFAAPQSYQHLRNAKQDVYRGLDQAANVYHRVRDVQRRLSRAAGHGVAAGGHLGVAAVKPWLPESWKNPRLVFPAARAAYAASQLTQPTFGKLHTAGRSLAGLLRPVMRDPLQKARRSGQLAWEDLKSAYRQGRRSLPLMAGDLRRSGRAFGDAGRQVGQSWRTIADAYTAPYRPVPSDRTEPSRGFKDYVPQFGGP